MIFDWIVLGHRPHAAWLGSELEKRAGASGKIAWIAAHGAEPRFEGRTSEGEKIVLLSEHERLLAEPAPPAVLEVWSESTGLSSFQTRPFRDAEQAALRTINAIDSADIPEEHSFTAALTDLGYDVARSRTSTALPAGPDRRLDAFEVTKLVHSDDKILVLGRADGSPTQVVTRRLALCGGLLNNLRWLRSGAFLGSEIKLGAQISFQPRMLVHATPGKISSLRTADPKLERLGLQLRPGFTGGLEVIVEDEPTARLETSRNGTFALRKDFSESEKERIQIALEIVKEASPALQLKDFERVPVFHSRGLFGGFKIGQNALESTLDPMLQLRDAPGIYVVDESALPGCPGSQTGFLATLALSTLFLRGV